MLVLTRRQGDSILIGDDIELKITRVEGNQASVAIKAPRHINIARKELLEGKRTKAV